MGSPGEEHGACASLVFIEAAVQRAVLRARRRWTAGALEREIAGREACPRPLVRKAIRRLIEGGRIEYCYTFGQSYLVMSLRQPVKIGARFLLVPSDYQGAPMQNRLSLVIASGSAFGSGRHPTTRLALQALERAWPLGPVSKAAPAPKVIDIGTGSGILAIAAARLGAGHVTALDIDACARAEALANIALNTGIAPITVSDTPWEDLPGPFDIVIANLRLPTLIHLLEWLRANLRRGSRMVVSGVRDDEWPRLKAVYGAAGLLPRWEGCEAGWAGGFFRWQSGG